MATKLASKPDVMTKMLDDALVEHHCLITDRKAEQAQEQPAPEILAKKDRLEENISDYYEASVTDVLRGELPEGATDAEVAWIRDRLDALPLLVRAELAVAIGETHRLYELTDQRLLDSIQTLDEGSRSTLIYAMRFTRNFDALSDQRMFSGEALRSYRELDSEAFSELAFAIGNTGDLALTDREVLRAIISASKADGVINAKLFGELAHSVGVTGEAERLTGNEFLEGLGSLPMEKRIELVSAIWVTGKVRELASAGVIERIGAGADVWNDVVMELRGGAGSCPTAVFVRLAKKADKHDRGDLLTIKSLFDSGHNVVYVRDAENPVEIARVAAEAGASALGFGILDSSLQKVIEDTLVHLGPRGLGGIPVFGGGWGAGGLEKAGIKVFGAGTAEGEVAGFLKSFVGAGGIQSKPNAPPNFAREIGRGIPSAAAAGRAADLQYAKSAGSGSSQSAFAFTPTAPRAFSDADSGTVSRPAGTEWSAISSARQVLAGKAMRAEDLRQATEVARGAARAGVLEHASRETVTIGPSEKKYAHSFNQAVVAQVSVNKGTSTAPDDFKPARLIRLEAMQMANWNRLSPESAASLQKLSITSGGHVFSGNRELLQVAGSQFGFALTSPLALSAMPTQFKIYRALPANPTGEFSQYRRVHAVTASHSLAGRLAYVIGADGALSITSDDVPAKAAHNLHPGPSGVGRQPVQQIRHLEQDEYRTVGERRALAYARPVRAARQGKTWKAPCGDLQAGPEDRGSRSQTRPAACGRARAYRRREKRQG